MPDYPPSALAAAESAIRDELRSSREVEPDALARAALDAATPVLAEAWGAGEGMTAATLTAETGKPHSDHVAISRMTLHDGKAYEVITVSRAFLIAALEDARSWCHEVETPWGPGQTSGNVADYDAALAVLEESPATVQATRTFSVQITTTPPAR